MRAPTTLLLMAGLAVLPGSASALTASAPPSGLAAARNIIRIGNDGPGNGGGFVVPRFNRAPSNGVVGRAAPGVGVRARAEQFRPYGRTPPTSSCRTPHCK
jgi:hypothetical protein